MRILSHLQEMGWQTTMDTRVRVLLVHFLTRRRLILQVLLKKFRVFVDAVHGCSTALHIGGTPTAIVRSHHVACPRSQQFCDVSQVSCKCVERTASAPTEARIGPTLIVLLFLVGKPQGVGRCVTGKNEKTSFVINTRRARK